MSQADPGKIQKQAMPVLVISAMGVVFGDIGTSPLYALREAFIGPHAAAATPDNVLGILSFKDSVPLSLCRMDGAQRNPSKWWVTLRFTHPTTAQFF